MAPPLPSSETIQRPEPGLGRGALEARPWVILALAFAFVAVAAVHGARRSGLWARFRKNARR